MTASPTTVSLILGVLGIAAALVGHYLSRRGKRDEIKMQQVAQAFTEKTAAFEQMASLVERYKADADRERQLRSQDRTEWEGRWSRQMDRCRKFTDSAVQTISALIRFVPPDHRRAGEHMLEELEEHRIDDHGGESTP